jgi:hypothetical protein
LTAITLFGEAACQSLSFADEGRYHWMHACIESGER